VLEKLIELYGEKLDDVDIWPAGLLETTPDGPGLLFRTIIKDQFERIRDGDRFWFENKENG
jgi:dual oxidase